MSTTPTRPSFASTGSSAIVSILVSFTFLIPSSVCADECPPLGVGGFNDYRVGGQTSRYNPDVLRTGSVGIAECGEFIVAYEALDGTEVLLVLCEGEEQYEDWISAYTGIHVRRFHPNGDYIDADSPYCVSIAGTDIHSFNAYLGFADPSLAMNRSGDVSVVFTGWANNGRDKVGCECPWPPDPECPCAHPSDGHLLLQASFPFNALPDPVPLPLSIFDWRELSDPSAGLDGQGNRRHLWGNYTRGAYWQYACNEPSQCETPHYEDFGWFVGPAPTNYSELFDCDLCEYPPTAWCAYENANRNPCISVRSDGAFVIAWADPVSPAFFDSSFDIKLRGFNSTGAQIGSDFTVNEDDGAPSPSDQVSPAVSMDDFGNVVVTWVGVRPAACEYPFSLPTFPIYARRYKFDSVYGLRDPNPDLGEGIKGPFVVDNLDDPDRGPLSQADANPTVALTMEQENAGAFFVAWNSKAASGSDLEVHGQYFGPHGAPVGREFRAHAATGPYDGYQTGIRLLAPTSRHTAAYGNQGQVVFA